MNLAGFADAAQGEVVRPRSSSMSIHGLVCDIQAGATGQAFQLGSSGRSRRIPREPSHSLRRLGATAQSRSDLTIVSQGMKAPPDPTPEGPHSRSRIARRERSKLIK